MGQLIFTLEMVVWNTEMRTDWKYNFLSDFSLVAEGFKFDKKM
jgi:hypothetical protein